MFNNSVHHIEDNELLTKPYIWPNSSPINISPNICRQYQQTKSNCCQKADVNSLYPRSLLSTITAIVNVSCPLTSPVLSLHIDPSSVLSIHHDAPQWYPYTPIHPSAIHTPWCTPVPYNHCAPRVFPSHSYQGPVLSPRPNGAHDFVSMYQECTLTENIHPHVASPTN